MKFRLVFTEHADELDEMVKSLETNGGEPNEEEVFESYAQNNTSRA